MKADRKSIIRDILILLLWAVFFAFFRNVFVYAILLIKDFPHDLPDTVGKAAIYPSVLQALYEFLIYSAMFLALAFFLRVINKKITLASKLIYGVPFAVFAVFGTLFMPMLMLNMAYTYIAKFGADAAAFGMLAVIVLAVLNMAWISFQFLNFKNKSFDILISLFICAFALSITSSLKYACIGGGETICIVLNFVILAIWIAAAADISLKGRGYRIACKIFKADKSATEA